MHAIRATTQHAAAIHATAELLDKLRIESMFVGNVARSAWLGGEISRGSIDVLALMNSPQKNQVAMMASHRGFRVEREELEATEELDLVPLYFVAEEGEVRIHILLATNALYGRMMPRALEAQIDERTVRVPAAEDFALMLLMAEDDDSLREVEALPGFDQEAMQERLASIGLGGVARA